MSKYKYVIIVLNLIGLIIYFNWSVLAKEKTLNEGKLVLLELMPVDPRSLMQGDYMNLDYQINALPEGTSVDKRGYCILKQKQDHTVTRVRFQSDLKNLKPDEIAIKYFSNQTYFGKEIHIGAESYFFEEGMAKKFASTRYGGLKIDQDGNSILIGLYDQNRNLIK
jgi:uncharacterized membrane-anchored protein